MKRKQHSHYPHYLKNFPKLGKEFEPFAFKGMLEFRGDLEGKCPKNTKFNDFFIKLKDYMACFDSTSPDSKDIQVQLTIKSESLFRAMSAFNGTKGGTSDRRIHGGWWMVDGLLSLGKVLVEMKKSGSNEITFEQRREMIQSMVKWTRGTGIFVKMASENEGRSIDLSSFGIDYDTNKPSNSKRSLSETRGTFSLPHYLKDLPKISKDFEPFAYDGMLDFLASLEVRCPATTEFKNFFAKVEEYMTCFKSGSRDNIKVDISDKSEGLFRAMSLLDGGKTGTSVESWRMMDGMLSIGKLLAEMKKNDSKDITFEQRK
ncbi:unnamed protein product [Thlaspi arvense]|uniref:DUF1216 domain-containing protein n=1 Tax=Thlaspi arvense TaxID=13288 RepID=A0AAU9RXJ5_THLAR|nr:unnamed protein product [Thlaspi arvense]